MFSDECKGITIFTKVDCSVHGKNDNRVTMIYASDGCKDISSNPMIGTAPQIMGHET